ncbi:MAG: LysR family transcriptional regulator [Streptosporangiales bacterium]|nr:LysR family transcriptional regulator [Streptosporangiales bacterium]
MEIRQLRTFLAVAQGTGVTAAARELGYAQSSVTAQIQALETGLGTALFERRGRRVALTDAGRALLPEAERVLRAAATASDRVRAAAEGDPAGPLAVAAPETVCAYRMPPVLAALRTRFPRLDVTFRADDPVRLLRELATGALDVAFLLEEEAPGGAFRVEAAIDEELRVVAAPGHRIAGLAEVTPSDLEGETLLLLEPGCAPRAVFERELRAAGVRCARSIEFTSVEAVKRCAAAGLGVAAIPAFALPAEPGPGEPVARPWHRAALGLRTWIVRHAERPPSAVTEALITTARSLWEPDGVGHAAKAANVGGYR